MATKKLPNIRLIFTVKSNFFFNLKVNASAGQGIKTMALLTDMENPIGYNIGNALEVAEALQCLHGQGPDDLTDIVCQLGRLIVLKILDKTTLV